MGWRGGFAWGAYSAVGHGGRRLSREPQAGHAYLVPKTLLLIGSVKEGVRLLPRVLSRQRLLVSEIVVQVRLEQRIVPLLLSAVQAMSAPDHA